MIPAIFAAVVFAQTQWSAAATIPLIINHQGELRDATTQQLVDGTRILRFAILDNTTPTPKIIWTNDGTKQGLDATTANVPTAGVTVTVKAGRYRVPLGDTTAFTSGMTAIPASVFQTRPTTFLRVWVQKTSASTIELLSPDQQLVSVPYAYEAETINGAGIANGSITKEKLARESVLPEHRGRSNSVESVAFEIQTSNATTTALLFTVPAGKTFVLTDVSIASSASGGVWVLRNSTTTVDFSNVKFLIDARSGILNTVLSMNAGVRFTENQQVRLCQISVDGQVIGIATLRGTISGYLY
ncbi:MAG: hypothetical protein V2A74_05615 [bacterium]